MIIGRSTSLMSRVIMPYAIPIIYENLTLEKNNTGNPGLPIGSHCRLKLNRRSKKTARETDHLRPEQSELFEHRYEVIEPRLKRQPLQCRRK
jgi:hypothetical protein